MKNGKEEKAEKRVVDLPVSLIISDEDGAPYLKHNTLDGHLRTFWEAYVSLFLAACHPEQESDQSKEDAIDNHHRKLRGRLGDDFEYEISNNADGERSTQSDLGWKSDSGRWVGHYEVTPKDSTTVTAYFGMENRQLAANASKEIYNSANTPGCQ